MGDPYKTLREEAYEANMELPRRGLVLYTFGNVSAFDAAKGFFAIKPSGVAYDDLTPAVMVIVDVAGKKVDGELRPSSDTPTHAYLYRTLPSINGIVHTHSTYAVGWAQARRAVPVIGTTHADHTPADIPCTPPLPDEAVQGDYEEETGKLIAAVIGGRSSRTVPMILVAGHGPFTWGESAAKAVYNSVVLEELCKMAFISMTLNPGTPRLSDALIKKHWERKHGGSAYYGQK